MASRDIASACKAEVSELLVMRDINEKRLMSAYVAQSLGTLCQSMGEASYTKYD